MSDSPVLDARKLHADLVDVLRKARDEIRLELDKNNSDDASDEDAVDSIESIEQDVVPLLDQCWALTEALGAALSTVVARREATDPAYARVEGSAAGLADRLRTEAEDEDDWYPRGGRRRHAPLLREAAARIESVASPWPTSPFCAPGRLAQFLKVLAHVREQAPDLAIEVSIKGHARVASLTLAAGGTIFEDFVTPSHGPISHSGGVVAPSEDPLAVAGSLIAFVRGEG